jgi:hypothetical protein
MLKMPKNLSHNTHTRLCIQGFGRYSKEELAKIRFGIRFAYSANTLLVAIGLATRSIILLALVMVMAAIGIVLHYHPFDYLYNSFLRKMIKRPKLPRRPHQNKFTFGLATVWLAIIIVLFLSGLDTAGYILGGILLAVAILVSTTDICIPSMMYNLLTQRRLIPR